MWLYSGDRLLEAAHWCLIAPSPACACMRQHTPRNDMRHRSHCTPHRLQPYPGLAIRAPMIQPPPGYVIVGYQIEQVRSWAGSNRAEVHGLLHRSTPAPARPQLSHGSLATRLSM